LSPAPPGLSFRAMHPDVFSARWATALAHELNASLAYREAAAAWEGDIALRMKPDATLGVPEPRTVWLDLHHGECREARPATDADLGGARYVVEADAPVWKELLAGRLSPVTALLAGKLRLARGSLVSLLPYASAAQLLVATAATIHQQFPEPIL
jgi:putative sterol carrier protein